MPKYTLTEQQQTILAAAREGGSIKIEALAGAAKTSTLCDIAEDQPKRKFIYLAYNNSTSAEARGRFPRNVTVKTGHALAFRHVGFKYKDRLGTGWETRKAVEGMLQRDISVASGGNHSQFNRYLLAVMDTLQNFQQSADDAIAESHVPTTYRHYCNPLLVASLATNAWERLVDERCDAKVSHDLYLKVFQLQKRELDVEAIMVDEMQDSNPVILAILAQQPHAQIIGVGDRHQSIYGWRGAVDALDHLAFPAFPLTKSWRFGPRIARLANAVLEAKGATLLLEGGAEDGHVLEFSESMPTAVITRTNAGLVNEVLDLLGMKVDDAGGKRAARVAVLGGVQPVVSQIEGAYELYDRGSSSHPNFRLFGNWGELREAVETVHSGSLRPFVNLVEKHKWRIPAICERLEKETVPQDRADVVVSTCHKFKGAESDRVRLGADFPQFAAADEEGRIEFRTEEANLAYVALTRARKELQVGTFRQILAESLRLSRILLSGQTHDPRVLSAQGARFGGGQVGA